MKKKITNMEELDRKLAAAQDELRKIEAERQKILNAEKVVREKAGMEKLAVVCKTLDEAFAQARAICDEHEVEFRYYISSADISAIYTPDNGGRWSASY